MLSILKKIHATDEKKYVVLNEEDCRAIDVTARRILKEVGFKVSHPRLLKILKKKEYSIDGDTVKIESSKIDDLLANVPVQEPVKTTGEGQVHVGYMASQIYDAEKDIVRYPNRKDLDQATVVGLSLPGINSVAPLFEPKDRLGCADVLMLDVMLRRVKNPVRNEIHNAEYIPLMLEMCKVVAGTTEEILKRNMLIYYAFITSPLKYDVETLDLAFRALDEGIPVRFGAPMTIAGATGPVTFAGTIALGLAESYTGLVLSEATRQQWEPGMAPVVMDQSTGASLYSGPDRAVLSMGAGDLFRYLGFECGVHLTQSDECKPGIQAGIEKTYTAMLFTLAGLPPTINNAGLLGPGGLVGSIEQIVIDAEIISMLDRLVRGMDVNEETLAFDTIKNVGIGGNFLSEEHTAAHFRKELWLPTIIKRLNPSAWNQEKPDMLREAGKKVKEILSSRDPRALNKEQENALDDILKRNGIN